MPSITRARRLKPLLTLIVLVILTFLYLTSSGRSTRDSAFYKNTVAALHKQHQQQSEAPAADGSRSDTSAAKLKQDLEDAGREAKAEANKKGDEMRKKLGMEELDAPAVGAQKPLQDAGSVGKAEGSSESPKEKSVAGRKTMKDEATSVAGDGSGKGKPTKAEADKTVETTQDDEDAKLSAKVDAELNSILKRSPIIIFSKSYCPYSKKAKRILLEDYKITPAPFVVELDEHDLGSEIQESLAKSTGRRTVPNIMINGKSIGGGDDVQAMHDEGTLIDKVKSLGGKRIMEMSVIKDKSVGEDGLKRRAVP